MPGTRRTKRWRIVSEGCFFTVKGKSCNVKYAKGTKTFTVRMSWSRYSEAKYPAHPRSPAQFRKVPGYRVTKITRLRRR